MNWRLAKSLGTLRDQVNARWPHRNKENDGTIGDAAHQSRKSDHDPDHHGVVNAIDITHDPKSGCDSYALAEVLRTARDPRVKYIISNRKIAAFNVDPWHWRPYHGANPHDHHVHVSVRSDDGQNDISTPWALDERPMPAPLPDHAVARPTLRNGDSGEAVRALQALLNTRGLVVKDDGGFGTQTETAVRTFQAARGLTHDGVVGPQTWLALSKVT